jgi:hypothetical protein
MGYIEWMVFQEKQGMPHVTFVKDGKLGILATQFIEDFKGDDKEAFAVAVKNLRKDCEVVCFGHEAWMAKIDKSQYATGKYVMPRLRPDRIEAGLVQVWIKGGRHVMFTAEIKRKPTRMEPWKISFDTAIDGDHIEGRFA